MTTAKTEVSLEVLTCSSCGTVFGMLSETIGRRRADGANFYCPNGHANIFSPSQLEQWKTYSEKLDHELKRERENRRLLIAQKAELEERLSSLHKKQETPPTDQPAAKERRKKEPCPVCGKKVKGLKLHMAHAHPDTRL